MKNEELYNLKNKIKIVKKSKKQYKKIFLFFIEIITLFIIFIGRHLYISSLKGCDGDEFSCLHNIKFIYDGMNRCIKSSYLFILILFFIQIKIAKKYNLIIIFLFFIEFLFKDRGNTFLHHGILNLYGFFLILAFGECLILIILLFIFLIKNKKYILLLFIIFIIFIFFIFLIFKINLKDKYF